MDALLLIIISLSLTILISLCLISQSSKKPKLPPGLPTFPIIGYYIRFFTSTDTPELLVRSVRAANNNWPLVSLPIGPTNTIIVASSSAAHQALIQHGSSFSSRPPNLAPLITLSGSPYGPTWRLLRRNMIQFIYRPQAFSVVRGKVLRSLLFNLQVDNPVTLMPHLRFAMSYLLASMCLGEDLTESQVKQIEKAQREFLTKFPTFNILSIFPNITKIFLRNKWNELSRLRDNLESAFITIITARTEFLNKKKESRENHKTSTIAYVDTLLDLELPETGRKLTRNDMRSLCSDFHDAGKDTTASELQWIMANLVKYPKIQAKLYEEIKGVLGDKREVEEEDLNKMKYLKAVVLEGLRRHPPTHFVIPHTTTDDVKLEGYDIPKGSIVNFMVADIGWDQQVWEDPMEFRPERFVDADVDLTGSKGIKMMPFGAGRRICPGMNLALLQLEYFVANFVWVFEWKVPEGEEVNLAEKREFMSTVMKYPLRVCLSPRA